MKTKAVLSAITSFFFGLIAFLVLRFLETEDALLLSLMGGLLCFILLFIFLLVYGRIMDKKYAEFEKEILSPIFYKTNGNLTLGNGRIRNTNIYFCEDRIILISLDEKPRFVEEIARDNISRIQCDTIHFNINTTDGNCYIIIIPDAKRVLSIITERGWKFPYDAE